MILISEESYVDSPVIALTLFVVSGKYGKFPKVLAIILTGISGIDIFGSLAPIPSDKDFTNSCKVNDSDKIKIKINGRLSTINDNLSLLNFLTKLKIPLKKVAIKLNHEIIDKNNLNKIKLKKKYMYNAVQI